MIIISFELGKFNWSLRCCRECSLKSSSNFMCVATEQESVGVCGWVVWLCAFADSKFLIRMNFFNFVCIVN